MIASVARISAWTSVDPMAAPVAPSAMPPMQTATICTPLSATTTTPSTFLAASDRDWR